MGWEAERAEDNYWMHGPNWPFDDSGYSPDTDEEVMDAFHGLPDGTTRRVRQREERARQMTGFGADESARARAKRAVRDELSGDELREYVDAGYERLVREGHGGWTSERKARPAGKGMSIGFAVNPLLILDALAKAAMGFGPEPSRFPSEPPEGSVLKWVKTYPNTPDRRYTYVAVHVNGAWYLTGRKIDPVTFDELVKMIGDSPCELAPNNWVEIPQLEPSPSDGLTPEEWFMAAYPQDVVDSDESRGAER